MLVDTDIAWMRDLRTQYLQERCTMEGGGTPTETPDDYGGVTTTYPVSTQIDIPCSYASTTAKELQASGTIQSLGSYTVTLPAGTVIAPTYTITIAARDGKPELRLSVVGEMKRSENAAVRVIATETT